MLHDKTLIAPSILSADFNILGLEIEKITDAGADLIHLDVMDGHFVPNISFGIPILNSIYKKTKIPIDCHLMITNPELYVEKFAASGADIITVHAEASCHLERLLSLIKSLGKKAGIAYNPQTGVEGLEYLVHNVDLVLIMTVNPGFGGQSFISSMLPKIERAAKVIASTGRDIMLEVDGGITPETKQPVIDAGAGVLVAGSSVFSKADYADAIRRLR